MNYTSTRNALKVVSVSFGIFTSSTVMVGGFFWWSPTIAILAFVMMKGLDKLKRDYDKKSLK